jgi:NAD(P)H-hydrate epimerase
MHILSVSETQALESTANMADHSYAQMMERAGQGVALAILRQMTVKGRRVLALVGPGNNGGDGLVAARLLQDAGAQVTAYLTRARDPDEDPVVRQAQDHGVTICAAQQDEQNERLRREVAQCHVLIDALLGTGATPPLRGTISSVLNTVHGALAQVHHDPLTPIANVPAPTKTPRPFIVAVDGPSGLNFDTGGVDPLTLKAHLTVTFATPKWGHVRFPGANRVGKLVVADIGIPKNIEIPGNGVQIVTPKMLADWLPDRPLNAHKGTFGKAMIVAGSVNYTGAVALSGASAVRSGVGLTTLAIPSVLHPAVVPVVPEATYALLPHDLGVLNAHAAALALEKMAGYSALLLGPGLGNTAETQAFVQQFLRIKPPKKRRTGFVADEVQEEEPVPHPPLVVDADGLNILSEIPDWPEHLPGPAILTPHPGEMARLTGSSIEAIQDDRLSAARDHARAWGHVVVLKGAFTVVASPEGDVMLLPFATPALSSAGTGDVLAGAIVALRAQGLAPFEAAVAGAYLHGLAGEIAGERHGTAGVAASDVVDALPEAWRRLATAP